MSKIIDLSPSMRIPSAEVELQTITPVLAMGQNVGGLSMYSNTFKRGYGNRIFGSDDSGIWLGAADFADAPFAVDMEGRLFAQSETGEIQIDTPNNRIVIYDENGVPKILIGKQVGGF